MRYLVTDASGWGDTATDVGGAFMDEFAKWLLAGGIDLTFLAESDVVRAQWDKALEKVPENDITWASHMGHGNYITITGYQQSVLAIVGGYDPALYQDRGLHFLSCQCGKLLLPDMVRNGLRVGVGYDENFTFYYTPGNPPLEDELASSFFDAHLTLDRALVIGDTVADAKAMSDAFFTTQANYWRSQGRGDVASVLLYDRDHHVLHGDGEWRPGENGQPPTPPDHEIVVVQMLRKTTGTDVEFRVSDSETKDPIEGALVEWGDQDVKKRRRLLLGSKVAATKTTDEDGVAWFRGVAPGTYPWIVIHENYITINGITEIE